MKKELHDLVERLNKTIYDAMKTQVAPLNITSENYHAIWCMTGICFETFTTPEVKLNGLGQIGFLSINYPVIYVSVFQVVIGYNI
jgi:hypothetical protein